MFFIIWVLWTIIFSIVGIAAQISSIPLLCLAIFLSFKMCFNWFPLYVERPQDPNDFDDPEDF